MVTEYGKLATSCIKWGLEQLSIEINDTELMLVSFLTLLILLLVLLAIKHFIYKTSENN